MPTIGQLLGKIPSDHRYETGEWVTGAEDDVFGCQPELDGKSFQVLAVRDIPCTCQSTLAPFPPGGKHEPHCGLNGDSRQYLTIHLQGQEEEISDAFFTHTLAPTDP